MAYPGPRPEPPPRPTRFSDDVATAVLLSGFQIGEFHPYSLAICHTLTAKQMCGTTWQVTAQYKRDFEGGASITDKIDGLVDVAPMMPDPPIPDYFRTDCFGPTVPTRGSSEMSTVKASYTLQPRTDWVRLGMWLTAGIVATATAAAIAGF